VAAKGRGVCGWGGTHLAGRVSKCTLDGSFVKQFAVSSFRANTWHIIMGIITSKQRGPATVYIPPHHQSKIGIQSIISYSRTQTDA